MKNNVLPIEIREIKKSGTYIASVGFHKGTKDVQAEINKVEIIFKSLGIKNIKVVPYSFGLFEVKE